MSYVYKIVRIVMELSKRSTKYTSENGAKCPICERFKPELSRAKVLSVQGAVRFCACQNPDCGHLFKAIGAPAKHEPAVEPEKTAPEIEKPVVKRGKSKKKVVKKLKGGKK